MLIVKRILLPMAEVKDMYKLTRFVNSKKYHRSVNVINSRDDLEIRLELANLFAERLIIKTDLTKALKLVNRTESNKYIRIIHNDGLGAYDLTDEGFHLIGRSYYFFRVGLWEETAKRYDKTQTILTTISVAIISAIGGSIIGYMINR